MIPLRSALVVDSPSADIADALWSPGIWSRAWSGCGFAVTIDGGDRLRPGQVIRVIRVARGGPKRAEPELFRVLAPDPPSDRDGSSGPIAGPTLVGVSGRARGWTLRCEATLTGGGCLVTVGAANPGRPWRPGLRPRVLRFQELFLGLVSLTAHRAPIVVVAGVIVEDGRVLVARRRYPPEVAGHWECPGGKVEPGEGEQQALVRELREELGITTEIGERVGPSIRISADFVLHAHRARIVAGRPVAHEHDEIAWVSADRLAALDWAPADRPLVPALRRLIERT